MKPNLPAIGRDATEHGWIKERTIHFTHLNTGRPLRRGSRPATAEEALPHAVGVAGAAPGSRAGAKRAHVGFLREQAESTRPTQYDLREIEGERDAYLEERGDGEGDVLGEVGPPPRRRWREHHFVSSSRRVRN
jgi:hypothetical protein